MPILRTASHFDFYRFNATKTVELERLSGRGPNREKTERVAHHILSRIDAKHAHVIVDVGCGDGTLLDLALCEKRIGVLPTSEEQNRLAIARPHLTVLLGDAQDRLPLPDAAANRVVCNGVLLHFCNLEQVRNAIAELARITKPGGTVYIGEIPEAPHMGIDHSSPVRWLRSLLRCHGPRAAVAGLKDLAVAATSKRELMFYPEPAFFSSPPDIIAVADSCRLRELWYERHPFAVERWDFLFEKV
jgi:SAM-dependent methyltransferase